MKLVGSAYKLELAQYMELQSFSQFSSDLGEETKYRLSRGVRLVELLKQVNGNPLSLGKQVSLLSLANQDLVSAMPQESIAIFKSFYISLPFWVSLYISARLIGYSLLSLLS